MPFDVLTRRDDSGRRTLESALDLLYEIVFSRPDLERSGILVGRLNPGSIPAVAAVIPLRDAARSRRAAIGHAEWAYALESMAAYYQGLEIVGWWVSRPGGRARAGKTDAETHSQFFHVRDQVLLLFDTSSRTAAVFSEDEHDRLRCVHRDRVRPRALTGAAAHIAAPPGLHRRGASWAAISLVGAAGSIAGVVLWLLLHASLSISI
jgi:hypothetical protein